jgi:hypothetical protein
MLLACTTSSKPKKKPIEPPLLSIKNLQKMYNPEVIPTNFDSRIKLIFYGYIGFVSVTDLRENIYNLGKVRQIISR